MIPLLINSTTDLISVIQFYLFFPVMFPMFTAIYFDKHLISTIDHEDTVEAVKNVAILKKYTIFLKFLIWGSASIIGICGYHTLLLKTNYNVDVFFYVFVVFTFLFISIIGYLSFVLISIKKRV